MNKRADTNGKIAELLLEQTYAERLEMALRLADVLNDQKAAMDGSEGFEPDDIASLIQGWAEAELEPKP